MPTCCCYLPLWLTHLTLDEDHFGSGVVGQDLLQVVGGLVGENGGIVGTEKISHGLDVERQARAVTYAVSPQTKTGTPLAIVNCAAWIRHTATTNHFMITGIWATEGHKEIRRRPRG